jgi:hypothetical protein
MLLNVRGVIDRALRLNGALAANSEPTADQMGDALIAFNTLKASWFGTLIGGRLTEQAGAGAFIQAENGAEYAAPSGIAFTLTAPADARGGARFGLVDAGLSFAAHNATVTANGRLIEGAAASLVLATNGDNRRWWYRGDAGNWVREAPWTDPSDALEFPDAVSAYFPFMLAAVLAPEYAGDASAEVIAGYNEGRAVLARTYAPRGRNQVEGPLGVG